MRVVPALLLSLSLPLPLLISGCALTSTAAPSPQTGASFSGTVHGGQQPVAGAHVYLMAAAETGYSQPSVSLLNAVTTGNSDTIGAYVPSDDNGNFTITGDYLCTPSTQVYLYVHGGDPGAGVNSALGLMTALGACPTTGTFALTTPSVEVNEVTTVAAAYALAGFAIDPLHVSSSGTPGALVGISNAFLNAGNLAEIVDGTALLTTPGGNGTAPQAEINLIANILAACVNSAGSSSTACSTLFQNTLSGGTTGTQPTDVAGAAINLAHHPGLNMDNLYGIPLGSPSFEPFLTYEPYDFSLYIAFTGGGVSQNDSYGKTIAVAGDGSIWEATGGGLSAKFSNLGVAISPAQGFGTSAGGGENNMQVDESGNAYAFYGLPDAIVKWAPDGTVLSPTGGFTITGGNIEGFTAFTFDPSGNLLVADFYNAAHGGNIAFATLSPSGTLLSQGPGQTQLTDAKSIAVDNAGHIWVSDGPAFEYSLTGTPLSSDAGDGGSAGGAPNNIAFDSADDVWINNDAGGIDEISPTGASLSPSGGYTAGGYFSGQDVAIDGAGNAWVPYGGSENQSIREVDGSGNLISPLGGYECLFCAPGSIALDASGDAWVSNLTAMNMAPPNILEYIGISTPVVVPLAKAVRTGTQGQRP